MRHPATGVVEEPGRRLKPYGSSLGERTPCACHWDIGGRLWQPAAAGFVAVGHSGAVLTARRYDGDDVPDMFSIHVNCMPV